MCADEPGGKEREDEAVTDIGLWCSHRSGGGNGNRRTYPQEGGHHGVKSGVEDIPESQCASSAFGSCEVNILAFSFPQCPCG